MAEGKIRRVAEADSPRGAPRALHSPLPMSSSSDSKPAAPAQAAPKGPSTLVTVLGSVLIVLVTALIVSSILEESPGTAPGLRKRTGRPSILQDAGAVVKRTSGPGIERF